MKKKSIHTGRESLYKFLRIMKITFVLVFFCAMSISASTYSQQKHLSFKVENESIKNVLSIIEGQSEYMFFYEDHLFDMDRLVKVQIEDKTLDEVLKQLFENSNVVYEIIDRQVILKKEGSKDIGPKMSEQDEEVLVKGTVFDNSQTPQPIPGVTVIIIGTTKGTITDDEGRFSIRGKKGQTLQFTFIGYEPTNYEIKKTEANLFVELRQQTEDIEDVTVVAFSKQKKESVIASISSVKASELKVPSSNLTTAFAGRMAGVISYQRSGEPGQDNAEFFIRGVTTFGYKKDPLILIDNIEMTSNDLGRLQPDDIASFSIMKDASASALYGSRGANGVILVTTKEGAEGRAKIDIRYETSMSSPTQQIELADPVTFMKLHNEAVKTRNPLALLPYSDSKIAYTEAGANPMVYPANNWYDLLFKKHTINNRLNFNLSGGGKIARYYIAATYNKDNGVLKVDKRANYNNNIDLVRSNLHSNVNINVTPTTEVVIRLNGNFEDYTGPIQGGSDLYRMAMWSNPVMFPAVYEPDEQHALVQHTLFGNYNSIGSSNSVSFINPYAEMVKGYKDYSSSDILAQVEFKQDLDFITEGLSARGIYNTIRKSFFDVVRSTSPYYYSISTYDNITDTYTLQSLNDGDPSLSYSEGDKRISTSTYGEFAVDYNRKFAEKHMVTGLLVGTIREALVGNAGDLQKSLPFRNMGLAGRLTYAYDDRYFFEGNFGYNGSERFSKKERWGFFPSAGLGWIVSNEPFYPIGLKSVLNKMKFRYTYGLVGNDAIGNENDRFFYLSNVNLNDSNYGSTFGTNGSYSRPGVSISRYENSDISWEMAYKTNYGLELGLFDKLEIQADLFRERRENILMDRSAIPSTMGLQSTPRANVGKASSHGLECSLDYNQNFASGWWLSARGNFTYAIGKFDVYEEPNYSATPWKSHVGRSINQTWGYVAERLFVDEREIFNSPQQNFGGDVPVMGGDIKFKDINVDGKINELDQVPIGYPTTPEIIYGFGFSTGYKGFDLSCFFQGSARSSFWINVEETSPFLFSSRALLKVYADSHWSEDNRDLYALWPRLADRVSSNNAQTSTWFMRDGSFLRLKSAEFGYTLPQSLISRIKMQRLRIYLSGTNLLTFSKFKLWDPEMGGNGLGYPVQKVFNAGVQISF